MPRYAYKGRDEAGRMLEGTVTAAARHDALAALRTEGLTVVAIDEQDPEPPPLPAARGAPPARKAAPVATVHRRIAARVSLAERAMFCRQLSIAVGAGVPLREALASITEDIDHVAFRRVLQSVLDQIQQGRNFSAALAVHEAVFGSLFVALMRAAEEAGSLPETLDQLATTLERNDKLARKVKSIAAYPIFVGTFFTLICFIMTVFVLPKFQDSFGHLGARIPTLTRVVFGANRYIMDHAAVFGLALAALVMLFLLYRRTPAGRRQLDGLVLKFPLFGPCMQKILLARVCRNLSVMVKGGVSITTAVEIVSAVSGNLVIREALLQAQRRIIDGNDIASSLGACQVFPKLIIRMVGVGESSGRLPEVLEKVSDAYEDQAESSIMVATSLFEPIMIIFFGAIVLTLVLAIYLPVFSAGSAVR